MCGTKEEESVNVFPFWVAVLSFENEYWVPNFLTGFSCPQGGTQVNLLHTYRQSKYKP